MNFSVKAILPTTCLAVVTLLAGCNKTLDFRNAEISNNKIYSAGSNTGFSGKVTNVPLMKLPAGKVAQLTKIIGGVTKDGTLSELMAAYAIGGALGGGGTAILCDIMVNDGVLDGDAACNAVQIGSPLFNLPFKKGALDGKVVVFDPKQKGTKIAEAAYTDGEMNGESKVLSASTGKVLHTAFWQNGVSNGPEAIFDATTGNRIFSGTIVKGLYDGEASSYSADGKLISTKIWKAGVVVQPNQQSTATPSPDDACVDLWLKAYRNEKGPDAPASADQLEEWNGWCQNGKKPESL